ncbi:hypothetical protein GOBAR_AA39654 [Gossypium barbadense]|uniref:Uncharacterized protein n=1 Tax=Gossypium barbadense TaxID=3634 RepID=A0A2P5VQL0_GOSBA|nr:hypothetical protein GOBAR_AA39654 [Gossypium barbadense]
MSSDTSDSSSYFDRREPDELIRALVEKWQGTDGEKTLGLHFIDRESNKVFIKAMPSDAPSNSTAVSCGNHVYVIGRICENDANPSGKDDVNDVFQLDLKDLEHGWRKTTSMLFPRSFPHVLAAEGKIYASNILLDLGFWCTVMPVALFTLITMIAYNLLDKKHLPIKWSSEFPVVEPPGSTLYRLGNGKLILGWGGIHAAVEHQSAITVPYPEDISGLSWNVLVHGVESRPMLIVKRNFEDAVNYFG